MNARLRYFGFVCVSLLATQAFAADMSGWSDKTVCRLVKSGGGQEHIDEATRRGIVCAQSASSSTKSKNTAPLDNPLDEIIISKNMVLIKNRAVFNQEREAIKTAFSNRSDFYWKGASECFRGAMMDWETSMKVEVAQSGGNGNFAGGSYDAYHKPISICLATMSEQLSRIQTTPDYLEDMMLTWSTDEVFELPVKSLPSSEYQLRMYGAVSYLGTFGGYYAINYQEFDYTDEERKIVEDYFSKQLIKVDMRNAAPRGLKSCDYYSTSRLAKGLNSGKMNHDTCGSPMLKATTGALALGLRLGDQNLFNAGIKNLKLLLKVFDKKGIFVPYAAGRGATALSYSSEIPLHLGAWTELLAIAGYDFLEHKSPNGMRIKGLVAAQFNILNNPDMLLKYTASNGAYGGKSGPTVAAFNKLSLIEKWERSNTNTRQVVRQSARYVDRFRPDLQEFRDQNYVEFDDCCMNYSIKSTDDHILFDPYLLYETNTKTEIDITKWNSHETSIVQAPEIITVSDIVSVIQQGFDQSRNFAQQDGSDTFSGSYDVQWFFENIMCKSCLRERQSRGRIVLSDGVGHFEPSGYGQPSSKLREQLRVYYDKDGSLMVFGDLDLFDRGRSYPTVLKGNLGSNEISGTWEEGDTVGFTLSEILPANTE